MVRLNLHPILDPDHGHRRFGRDAIDVATEIDVEHGIANHDDVLAVRRGE